jgi:2'-5' RNA ligase
MLCLVGRRTKLAIIRSFIAINLSPEIYRGLKQVLGELSKQVGEKSVRWVSPTNIHLTLKFLGEVSEANLDMVKKVIQTQTTHFSEFEISVGELGVFPSIKRPRVIWVGVQGPLELRELQNAIDIETSAIGYASEDRPFSPHLTLGRISKNASPADFRQISDVLSKYKVGSLGATCVEAVCLYKSDLYPNGAVYTLLQTAPLRKST